MRHNDNGTATRQMLIATARPQIESGFDDAGSGHVIWPFSMRDLMRAMTRSMIAMFGVLGISSTPQRLWKGAPNAPDFSSASSHASCALLCIWWYARPAS